MTVLLAVLFLLPTLATQAQSPRDPARSLSPKDRVQAALDTRTPPSHRPFGGSLPGSRALRGLQTAAKAQASVVFAPDEVVTEVRSDSGWDLSTRTRHAYSGSELMHQYEDEWDPASGWVEVGHSQFSYQEGLLLEVVEHELGVPTARTTYQVENGVYTSYTVEAWDNGWVPEERTVLTSVGTLTVAGVTETWTGAGFTATERFTVVQSGPDVVETYESESGTGWTFTERYVYPDQTIASLHLVVEELLDQWSAYEDLMLALRLPDYVELYFDGTDWMYYARQRTEVETSPLTGHVTQETVTYDDWAGSDWEASSRLVVRYSESPGGGTHPTRLALQVTDGTDWYDMLVEDYVQDPVSGKVGEAILSIDLGLGLEAGARTTYSWLGLSTFVEAGEQPRAFSLEQNYPNPFNPATQIVYSLAYPQAIRLAVVDLLGREVAVLASGLTPAGTHAVSFDAGALPSGIYHYTLRSEGGSVSRPMILMK